MADETTLHAGGGVVWREGGGRVEVALVHRPRYDDWSLPKGKLDRGESVLAAAVREVGEELGSRVVVGGCLGFVDYSAARGGSRVPKRVTYWSMRHVDGEFTANAEIDDIAWVSVRAARRLLSYRHDEKMLDAFAAQPRHDRAIVLVRHGRAGKRREWRGDDAQRPLDSTGEAQAGRLGSQLAWLQPVAVYAADRARCVQTVEPLARRLGQRVVVDAVFSDESYAADAARAQKALLSTGVPGHTVVVCSQGVTIPGLVESLAPKVADSTTRKGAFWLLPVAGDDVVGADRYEYALQSL